MTGVEVEAVHFAVPTHYTVGECFGTWQEAVDYARSTITTVVYHGQKLREDVPEHHPKRRRQDGNNLLADTRAFVHMREVEPIQDRGEGRVRSGSDGVVRSWEVFSDGTTERLL